MIGQVAYHFQALRIASFIIIQQQPTLQHLAITSPPLKKNFLIIHKGQCHNYQNKKL